MFRKLFPLAALCAPLAAGAIDVDEPEVRAFIDELVRDEGLDREDASKLLASAEFRPEVIEAMSRAPERTVEWSDYRAIFMDSGRISSGKAFGRLHAESLAKVESDTGVPASVVLGILGVETRYGRITGRHLVLDSLATLAFHHPRRGDFFRRELKDFLVLHSEDALDAAEVLGSYAGAMGRAQFIPSSYRRYAVDGDGDGRRDLFSNWRDVLSSVAGYLSDHGWRRGGAVAMPARLAANSRAVPQERGLSPPTTLGALRSDGVLFDSDLPDETPAGLLLMQGADGPEYWLALPNFYVITRYNRSYMYALVVHQLGQAITSPDTG